MNTPELRRFVIRFLASLFGFVLIWPLLSSHYHGLVLQVIQLFWPGLTGASIYFNEAAAYFNIGLLVALLLATPYLQLGQRTVRLGLGLSLLFGLHVLVRLLTLQGALGLVGTDPYPAAWLFLFSETAQMFWPILIWASLTFRVWLPQKGFHKPQKQPRIQAFPKPALIVLVSLLAVTTLFALHSSSSSYAEETASVESSASDRTSIRHFSSASGNVESDVKTLTLNGLKTRFRKETVTPGTREVIVMAVGICDRGVLVNTQAQILPEIASTAPAIAGGLKAVPCVIGGDASDRLATGINNAVLAFRGPLAKYIGTVRMYVDLQKVGGESFTPGNGTFFEPGELVSQVVPDWNESTKEALAVFGPGQGQVLFSNRNTPVATVGDGTTLPMILIFTADIDASAPMGTVEATLGLTTFDDTAQGASGPCRDYISNIFGTSKRVNCGSNFMTEGPTTQEFTVHGEMSISAPTSLAELDTNDNGEIEDDELQHAYQLQKGNFISSELFFAALEAWTNQASITSDSEPQKLRVRSVSAQTNPGQNQLTFVARGQGIASIRVSVYSLDGRTIYRQRTAGNRLTWNQTTDQAAPVANGVYLYQATVKGSNGQSVTTDIRKLMVLR